jgi:hypothetical protein
MSPLELLKEIGLAALALFAPPAAVALCVILGGCSAVSAYNARVAAREDSVSVTSEHGEIGGKWIHRVEYRSISPK